MIQIKNLNFSKIKRFIVGHKLVSAGVVIAFIFAAKWMNSANKNKVNFETAKVEYLDTFIDEVACLGRPKSLVETYLSVQHGGRLDLLNKPAGSSVKTGEIIAVIDRTANAAGLKSALSGYRLAQSEYSRTSSLFRSGSTTREQMDTARSNADVKRAELEQAKQRVEDSIVRSPIDGVVSVLVFKVGDKVPDGGRVAAVEDPTGTQLTCRLPAEIAVQLTSEQTVAWTLVDQVNPGKWTVPSKISVEQPQGGFAGLDREVRIETNDPEVKKAAGKATTVMLKLPLQNNVTRLPSLADIRKQTGTFVLQKTKSGNFEWIPVTILKQSAQETVVQGIASGSELMLLKDSIAKIEAYVAPRVASRSR